MEADKKNISKCISGFANSDGGIIIWGVSTSSGKKDEPDTAKALKPISELKKFINLLNRLEGQAVTPTPKGVIHEAFGSAKDVGYVKTFVPTSDNAPHMANFANKHYFKRSGDSFYQCEHYDIRDMFHRVQNAELALRVIQSRHHRNFGDNTFQLEAVVSITNGGRNFARAPQLKITINEPFQFAVDGFNGTGSIPLFGKRDNEGACSATYHKGPEVIIYPELAYPIDSITVEVNGNSIDKLPELIFEYMIVGENMPMKNDVIKIQFEKMW